MKLKDQFMWVALDPRGRIQATWYCECVQSYRTWRKAVKGLGWKPKLCLVTRKPKRKKK